MRRYPLIVLFILLPMALLAQNVSNIAVQQKGEKIEVSYTLDKEADTYLSVVVDGSYHFCRSVSGDIGTNVSAGRNTVTWDVLADVDEFVGEAVFTVHASQSTRTKQTIAAKKQKEENKAEKLKNIFPLAGFDVSGGFYGLGGAVYWPWVTSRHTRVGSYFSYTYGMQDWKDTTVDGFHNLCLGMTVTVSQHVALFAAPGLSIVKNKYEHQTTTRSPYGYYDYISTYYSYATNYKLVIEGGISFKLLCFTLSAKYAYPSYLGFGLGLDFGWLK